MKIAILAPLTYSIPPVGYGGIERIVSYLTDGLAARGHNVTLFASGDSKTRATLSAVWPQALSLSPEVKKPDAILSYYLSKVFFDFARDFDIIFTHEEYYSHSFARFIQTPVFATLHSVASPERDMLYASVGKRVNYVAISKRQKELYAPSINIVEVIHHGIPLEDYPYQPMPQEYIVWIGRITPAGSVGQKGAREAIEIAKKAGKKIKLAGKVAPYQAYFDHEIKPLIDGDQVEFFGELDISKKALLLGGAQALILPLQWEEPFGLVAVEAMACGTPVIGTPIGAMPEIIEDGKTGFLCTIDEMPAAISRIHVLDRMKSRKRVEANFFVDRMVKDYERLFENAFTKTA